MIDRYFKIGSFAFLISSEEETIIPTNFMKFEIQKGEIDYTYHIYLVDELPMPTGKAIATRQDIKIFHNEYGEERLLGIKGLNIYYAYYKEIGNNQAEIYLDRNKNTSLHIDPVFTSLLALERRMLERNSLIFHCAYICYKGKAILFSAPSNTGKTTQANLWEKYLGSRTINGDKALIRKIGDFWVADGWPVCGTSEICNNEIIPIHAIVMLRQAPVNQVKKLNALEAFMLIYSQMTINSWNRQGVIHSSDLIEKLTTDIPIYELGCTISKEAVVTLKEALFLI